MAGNYRKVELIGSGTFGRAWLVQSRKSAKKYVIKEIQVAGMSERSKNQSLTEVEVLARCKHVNVIRYKEAFVDQGMLNIAMEYADSGDLQQRIRNQKGQYFPEAIVLDWFVQMCYGLRYIHGQNILHRDLKSQNIFLTGDNLVKIGDFGIAKILQDDSDHASTAIGTPYYLSPEICQRQSYNHKSDMWALGCVLYELTCLSYPFEAPAFSALVVQILQGKYKPIPRHYGALLEDLVSVLLRVAVDGRPSADQILRIPAIQPYVNCYCDRYQRLRQCSPSVTPHDTPLMDRPPAAQDKENVFSGVKQKSQKLDRRHSLNTPRSRPLQDKNREVNSDQSHKKVLEAKAAVGKVTPKMSMYQEMMKKQHRKEIMKTAKAESKKSVGTNILQSDKDVKPHEILAKSGSTRETSITISGMSPKSGVLRNKTYNVAETDGFVRNVTEMGAGATRVIVPVTVGRTGDRVGDDGVSKSMNADGQSGHAKGDYLLESDRAQWEVNSPVQGKHDIAHFGSQGADSDCKKRKSPSDGKQEIHPPTKVTKTDATGFDQIQRKLREVVHVMYESCPTNGTSTFGQWEMLTQYLENQLDVEDFIRIRRTLQAGFDLQKPFVSVLDKLEARHLVYLPIFIHMLTLEGTRI